MPAATPIAPMIQNGCVLNPDLLEWYFTQDPPVSRAVQGRAPGESEVLHPCLAVHTTGHPKHDLFSHVKKRRREVHFTLGDFRFRITRGPPKWLWNLPDVSVSS